MVIDVATVLYLYLLVLPPSDAFCTRNDVPMYINVPSGVPQGFVFKPLLLFLYKSDRENVVKYSDFLFILWRRQKSI